METLPGSATSVLGTGAEQELVEPHVVTRGERRKRDAVGKDADDNVIEDGDLRGSEGCRSSGDGHLHGDGIRGGNGAGGDVVHLRGRAGGDALAGRRSDDAELAEGGVASRD